MQAVGREAGCRKARGRQTGSREGGKLYGGGKACRQEGRKEGGKQPDSGEGLTDD